MAATLKDVAQRAKVSSATVSLVLNAKPGISERTRARVLQAAAELDYTPAASRGNETGLIGQAGALRFLKIARHGHTVNRDHNVFISDFIDGMSSEASQLGYKLEVLSFEGAPIGDIAAALSGNGIDGAVVLGTELTAEDIQTLRVVDSPFVIIDTYCDYLECNFVDMNNKDAVHKIVAHLVDCGFRDIGMISSSVPTMNFHLRKAAFVEACRHFGLPVSEDEIVIVDSTYQGAYEDMLGKLQAGIRLPECYFCANDIISYGCIKAFREFDIDIPRALSIVGFDNLPMSSTMDPPLTTIDVSKQKIGDLAVRLLDQLIRSPGRQPSVKILVGTDLVIRDSVAPRRQ
jgi:LacI family transcriptional regulator